VWRPWQPVRHRNPGWLHAWVSPENHQRSGKPFSSCPSTPVRDFRSPFSNHVRPARNAPKRGSKKAARWASTGNYSRSLGYFDAPPGPEPTIIELTEFLGAKNDTIKLMPVALPFVYLNPNNKADYLGPGLKVHWVEVGGPFPEVSPTESHKRVFGDAAPRRTRRSAISTCSSSAGSVRT
jgi:hypothetical protein